MIDLDITSSTAPYEQIRAQLAAHVDTGALQPGDRLPTVRRLTKALGLSAAEALALVRHLQENPPPG